MHDSSWLHRVVSLRRRPARLAIAGASGLALIALLSGIALAAGLVDANGHINACVSNQTGAVRLVPSKLPAPYDTTCNTATTNPLLAETPLQWNQVGPVGPAGPQGPKGDAGGTGPQGPAGPAGLAGSAGASVATSTLAAGDANCPSGGQKLTSATGVSYVCNGGPGRPQLVAAIGGPDEVIANCPANTFALSGGAQASEAFNYQAALIEDRPVFDAGGAPRGWAAKASLMNSVGVVIAGVGGVSYHTLVGDVVEVWVICTDTPVSTTPLPPLGAAAQLSASALVFDPAGQTQTVTLNSIGTQALNDVALSIQGPFRQTNNCPTQLAPGASCTITVSFVTPSSGSVRSALGTLTVTTSGPVASVSLQATSDQLCRVKPWQCT